MWGKCGTKIVNEINEVKKSVIFFGSDIYPKKAVGSMMGLSGFIGAIGAALSASFIGLFLEATNSYYYIFVLVSVIYFINWLIIKILLKR